MKHFGFSAILLWEIGWVVFFFFPRLILGKPETEILQRALWFFFNLSAHISAVQRCLFSFPESRLQTGRSLWRGWACTKGKHFQEWKDRRWQIEVWRAKLPLFSCEAKNAEIAARFHGNERKKDWPALLSNREFLHPANWDQDQLRRAGAAGWVCDVDGRSQSSLYGTACTPQPSLSLWEWHSVPAGNSECLGQTCPHGETRLLLLCF